MNPGSEWERLLPHFTALLEAGGHVTLGCVEPVCDITIASTEGVVTSPIRTITTSALGPHRDPCITEVVWDCHGRANVNSINRTRLLSDSRCTLCDSFGGRRKS